MMSARTTKRVLFYLYYLNVFISYSSSETINLCQGNTTVLSCSHTSLLNILDANYGRMSTAICQHKNMNSTQCVFPKTLQIVKKICEGKKQCLLRASDDVFGCSCCGTHNYLSVDYICHARGRHSFVAVEERWILNADLRAMNSNVLPTSFGVGKMYLNRITDDMFEGEQIITWENIVGTKGNGQHLGWYNKGFAGEMLEIRFWIKFVDQIPSTSNGFGVNVLGVIHNDWIKSCSPDVWCYASLRTKPVSVVGNDSVILTFDSIEQRQIVHIADFVLTVLQPEKPHAPLDVPVVEKTSTTVNIQAEVPFDGNSLITMYQVKATDVVTNTTYVFQSNTSNITLNNLVMNRQYTIRVRAQNDVGFGNFSAPYTIKIDRIGVSTEIPKINGSQIIFKNNITRIDCLVTNISLKIESYRWLKDGNYLNRYTGIGFLQKRFQRIDSGAYICEVSYRNNVTVSSNVLQVIVLEKPEKPSDIEVVSTNDSTLTNAATKTLSWDAPYHGMLNISLYEIIITDLVTRSNATLLSPKPYVDITDLVLNRNYSVKIRAKNDLGFGEFSILPTLYTDISLDKIPRIIGPVTPVIANQEFMLNCSVVNDSMISYTTWLKDGVVVSVGKTFTKISEKQRASYSYICQVTWKNNNIVISSFAKQITVLSKPEAPYNVSVRSYLTRGYFDINWYAPFDGNSNIKNYTVQITDSVTQTTIFYNTSSIGIRKSTKSMYDKGMMLNRQYFVRVFAENAIGKGDNSSDVPFIDTAFRANIVGSTNVKEGDQLSLTCNYADRRIRNWITRYWIINGKRISLAQNNYKKTAEKNDSGLYLCEGTQSFIYLISSAVVQVNILYEPSQVRLNSSLVRVRVGSSLQVVCHTEHLGLPRGTLQWIHNGKILTESTNHKNLQLEFSKVEGNNSGIYKCLASNEVGSNQKSFQLLVQDVPGAPDDITVISQNGSNVNIGWRLISNGSAPILRQRIKIFKDGRNPFREVVMATEDTFIRNLPLVANRHYIIQIRAENFVGAGQNSAPFLFTMENVTGYLTRIKAPDVIVENQSTIMSCETQRNSDIINVTWFKQNINIGGGVSYTISSADIISTTGVYVCEATFISGVVAASTPKTLKVVRQPDRPVNMRKRIYGSLAVSRNSSIHWDSPFDGHSQITYYEVRIIDNLTRLTRYIKTNDTIAIFNDFATNRNYLINIRARNFAGFGPFSVEFVFIAEFEQANPVITGNLSIHENEQLNLSCNLPHDESNPYFKATYKWRNSSGTTVAIGSSFIVKYARRNDADSYVCEVFVNQLIYSSSAVKVIVEYVPGQPSDIQLLFIHDDSIKLQWKPPFNGNTKIVSYEVHITDMFYQPSFIRTTTRPTTSTLSSTSTNTPKTTTTVATTTTSSTAAPMTTVATTTTSSTAAPMTTVASGNCVDDDPNCRMFSANGCELVMVRATCRSTCNCEVFEDCVDHDVSGCQGVRSECETNQFVKSTCRLTCGDSSCEASTTTTTTAAPTKTPAPAPTTPPPPTTTTAPPPTTTAPPSQPPTTTTAPPSQPPPTTTAPPSQPPTTIPPPPTTTPPVTTTITDSRTSTNTPATTTTTDSRTSTLSSTSTNTPATTTTTDSRTSTLSSTSTNTPATTTTTDSRTSTLSSTSTNTPVTTTTADSRTSTLSSTSTNTPVTTTTTDSRTSTLSSTSANTPVTTTTTDPRTSTNTPATTTTTDSRTSTLSSTSANTPVTTTTADSRTSTLSSTSTNTRTSTLSSTSTNTPVTTTTTDSRTSTLSSTSANTPVTTTTTDPRTSTNTPATTTTTDSRTSTLSSTSTNTLSSTSTNTPVTTTTADSRTSTLSSTSTNTPVTTTTTDSRTSTLSSTSANTPVTTTTTDPRTSTNTPATTTTTDSRTSTLSSTSTNTSVTTTTTDSRTSTLSSTSANTPVTTTTTDPRTSTNTPATTTTTDSRTSTLSSTSTNTPVTTTTADSRTSTLSSTSTNPPVTTTTTDSRTSTLSSTSANTSVTTTTTDSQILTTIPELSTTTINLTTILKRKRRDLAFQTHGRTTDPRTSVLSSTSSTTTLNTTHSLLVITPSTTKIKTVFKNNAHIQGLILNRFYSVKIRAKNEIGFGSFSIPVIIATSSASGLIPKIFGQEIQRRYYNTSLECQHNITLAVENVTWFKGNQPIPSRGKIYNNNWKMVDSGVYSCEVTYVNGVMAASDILNITVVWKPNIPRALGIVSSGATNLNISWIPPFDGNSPIIRYEVELTDEVNGRVKTLNTNASFAGISNLVLNRNYVIKVRAENEAVGFGEFSTELTIGTVNTADLNFCRTSWTMYQGNCYSLQTVNHVTWQQARDHCKNYKGDLLSVMNINEQRFVENEFSNYTENFWIGLTSDGYRNFSWSTGSKLSIPWVGPLPILDNQDDRCVMSSFVEATARWEWQPVFCGATTNALMCKANAKTKVNTPTIRGPRTVTEGETINFSCTGSPSYGVASYTWLKDDSVIGNGSVYNETARRSEEGGVRVKRYLCEVKYTNNDVISSAARSLVVHYKPEGVRLDIKDYVVEIVIGKKLNLLCSVQDLGLPKGSVEWISPNSRVIAHVSDNSVRLFLSNVRREDNGRYICRAKNRVGRRDVILEVVIVETPDQPTLLNATNVNSSLVSLSWNKPYDGKSRIIEYEIKVNNRTHTSNNTVLLLAASPNTNYHFIVRARNKDGYGNYSNTLQHKTLVAAPPPYNKRLTTAFRSNATPNSFIIHVVKFQEINGKISWYQIVAKQLSSNDTPTKHPNDYSQEDIRAGLDGLKLVAANISFAKYYKVDCLQRDVDGICVEQPKENTFYTVFVRAHVSSLFQSTSWYPPIKTPAEVLLPFTGELPTPERATEDTFTAQLVEFNEKYVKADYYVMVAKELTSNQLPSFSPSNYTNEDIEQMKDGLLLVRQINYRANFGSDIKVDCFLYSLEDNLTMPGLIPSSRCVGKPKADTYYTLFVRGYVDGRSHETTEWYTPIKTATLRRGIWLYWKVVAECIPLNGRYLKLFERVCNIPGRCKGRSAKNESCDGVHNNISFTRSNEEKIKISVFAKFSSIIERSKLISLTQDVVSNFEFVLKQYKMKNISVGTIRRSGRAELVIDFIVVKEPNHTLSLEQLSSSFRQVRLSQQGIEVNLQGITDFDECAEGAHTCDIHAHCTPDHVTFGFICQCKDGYHGDGINCTKVGKWSPWKPKVECILQNGTYVKIYGRRCESGVVCFGESIKTESCVQQNTKVLRRSAESQFKGEILLENVMLANRSGRELIDIIQRQDDEYNQIVNVTKQSIIQMYLTRNIIVKQIRVQLHNTNHSQQMAVRLDFSIVTQNTTQDRIEDVQPLSDNSARQDIFPQISGYRAFTSPSVVIARDVDECVENTHKCHNDAHCIKFENIVSYSCQCKQGFIGDGFRCAEEQIEVDWSDWTIIASCVPERSQSVRIFTRQCQTSSGVVVDDQKCSGNITTRKESCVPSLSSPFTESNTSIAKGRLVLKNLTVDGIAVTNEDLEKVIAENGELYQELKNTTETSLLLFYQKKNPDVERVDVTELSVGSLVVSYLIILKGGNKTTSDLEVFTNNTVNIFAQHSTFAAETSARFSSITDYDECKEEKHACDANAYCLTYKHKLSYGCQCKDLYVGNGFSCVREKESLPEEEESTILVIVVGIVAGLFVVFIVTAIAWYIKRSKRQQRLKREKYFANSSLNPPTVESKSHKNQYAEVVVVSGETDHYFMADDDDVIETKDNYITDNSVTMDTNPSMLNPDTVETKYHENQTYFMADDDDVIETKDNYITDNSVTMDTNPSMLNPDTVETKYHENQTYFMADDDDVIETKDNYITDNNDDLPGVTMDTNPYIMDDNDDENNGTPNVAYESGK